jgi:hypothetical protein
MYELFVGLQDILVCSVDLGPASFFGLYHVWSIAMCFFFFFFLVSLLHTSILLCE